MEISYLSHHGIKGQKWGIRRFQKKDGSLTPAGKKRAGESDDSTDSKETKKRGLFRKKEAEPKKRTLADMSDDELNRYINRVSLEKRYIEAVQSQQEISRGKQFAKTVMNDMVLPAAKDTGKQLIKVALTKAANKAFKLDGDYKVYTNNKKKN